MSFRHPAGSGSVWLADRTLPSNPNVFNVVVSAMYPAEDHAYVLISAAPGAVARLAERLPALSGVVDVTALLGPHDALASVAVRPPLRIRDVVTRIAATEGVVDVTPGVPSQRGRRSSLSGSAAAAATAAAAAATTPTPQNVAVRTLLGRRSGSTAALCEVRPSLVARAHSQRPVSVAYAQWIQLNKP